MTEAVEYLELEDLIDLATRLLGDPPPIRDVGLLGSAVSRPQTTVFGEDAYSDLWTKAGAVLQSIVKNHALIDGNKRLGWLATGVLLELNGIEVTRVANDDIYRFVMDVAAGSHDVDELAAELQRLGTKRCSQRVHPSSIYARAGTPLRHPRNSW